MRSFFVHLVLKPILKARILKVKRLTSLPLGSLWSHLLFTESELQLITSNSISPREANTSISVVVIHHEPSRLLWLVDCIESLQLQSYKDFEIVLVVNYDISSELRNLMQKFSNVKVLFFKNSHPSQARNFGLQNCDSELILFVDDDNLLLPWHVLFFVNAYQTHPDAAVYFGSYLCFENETVTNFPLRYLVNRNTLLLGDPTDVSSIAFKRICFPAMQWDDQVLSENWAFLVDALDTGLQVHQISAPLSLHRGHLESRTKKIERPLVPSEWFEKYRNEVNWGLKIPESTGKAKRLKIIHAFRTIIDL